MRVFLYDRFGQGTIFKYINHLTQKKSRAQETRKKIPEDPYCESGEAPKYDGK
jgi:hypothetical protein